MRRGDGRAEILSLETLGADGHPTAVWQSGEDATVRVTVRYHDAVEEPVIGILIRTRIGLEVYGTNTELEKVSTGSCAAGTRMRIEFAFRCDFAPANIPSPQRRTMPTARRTIGWTTRWQFSVTDSRYTAGVANLRAKVKDSVPSRDREGADYFCSRINVGAIPDSVENPDGPTAVSQLEQPCTLPR